MASYVGTKKNGKRVYVRRLGNRPGPAIAFAVYADRARSGLSELVARIEDRLYGDDMDMVWTDERCYHKPDRPLSAREKAREVAGWWTRTANAPNVEIVELVPSDEAPRGIHAFSDVKVIDGPEGYRWICPVDGCGFEPSWARAAKGAAFGTTAKAKGEIRRHIIAVHPERVATWRR